MPDIGKEEKIRGYSRKRNLYEGGGGVRQKSYRGIGVVDAKMQDGVCQMRCKEKKPIEKG